MRKSVLILAFGLSAACVSAQSSTSFNSGLLILKANDLHNEGKYKEAIALYRQVPRNDSNYVRSLYELSLTYHEDSNYAAGMAAIREAELVGVSQYEADFITSKANLLDDMGSPESALHLYDSALLKFKHAEELKLNRAITLMRLNRYPEAEKQLQELLVVNPFFSSAHMKLAACAVHEGRLIPAMMAAFSYLIVNPDGRHQQAAIRIINQIATKGTEIEEVLEKRAKEEEVFGRVEKVILSKMAFNNNYKLQASLDDQIVRQLQALCESITYDASSNDFYMQYYVPVLKEVISKKMFEPIIMEAFSGLELAPIKQYVKKNRKELEVAARAFVVYFDNIRSTQELDPARRAVAEATHLYLNNNLLGIGKSSPKGDPIGPWQYFHPQGSLKATGQYNEAGKKQGRWTFYSVDGKLSSVEEWENGNQNGEQIAYYPDGNISARVRTVEGTNQGPKLTYYSNGNLKNETPYSNGQEEGLFKSYYASGQLRQEVEMHADKMNGKFAQYHRNGKVEIAATYRNGELEGLYHGYYDNGKPSFEASYIKGKPNGVAKNYHPNGKLKEERTFVNGQQEGTDKEYNDAGTLISALPMEKDLINGLGHYYDHDGKEYSDITYEKGSIRVARYLDKNGKEIASYQKKGRSLKITTYDADGIKVADQEYNDKGKRTGTTILYYPTGKVHQTLPYVDGAIDGTVYSYYPDGTRELAIAYKDGDKEGFDSTWFPDGKLKLAGFNSGGSADGEWIRYYENGKMSERYFYRSGEFDGFYENYNVDGSLDMDILYDGGWVSAISQYDTTGKRVFHTSLNNISSNYTAVFGNGQKRFEVPYIKGDMHGTYRSFHATGALQTEKTYVKGLLQGKYNDYNYNGKLSISGSYENGERNGTWNYYTIDGRLWQVEQYQEGNLEGKAILYHSNGKVKQEIDYHNGEKHGYQARYAPNGALLVSMLWEYGTLKGYTYYGKDGKLLPLIALPGGTGKVAAFYSNGNRSFEVEYIDGNMNGRFVMFHDNGKPYYSGTELFGNTTGESKEYYETGQLFYEYNYLLDNIQGESKEYYENGKLKELGHHVCGYPHGWTIHYDNTGKETGRYYFFNGILTATK
jgi:antitoxin component YwqK of YwqJK toxin-antitoxin module